MATAKPAASVTAPSPVTTPTATAWQTVGKGIMFLQRQQKVNDVVDWVSVVRVDLTQAKLQMRYAPSDPRSVRAWQTASDADIVINAGFFNDQKQATGLLIADGKAFGKPYVGFGGMFSIRAGKPQLQWLAIKPYAQDKQITQAVHSFPMLVVNGKVVDGIPENGDRNRRSFVALDRQGRVVLGVCHSPVWTLTDLARYLAADTELNLSDALNLDGGASTGMWVRGIADAHLIDSVEAVPEVITINAR